MATAASRLLRAARNASLACRAAAAAASRSAAMASRSARAAAAAARAIAPLESCLTRRDASTKPREDFSSADYEHLPDDAKTPTDKDLESDEAVWALYERWCKAFNKERDHAEMARRFKIFRYRAKYVHHWNTHLPPDPEEAAIYLRKRREANLLLSKGENVSHLDECYLPMELGPFADGGDPVICESSKRLLKAIEEQELSSAVEDVE